MKLDVLNINGKSSGDVEISDKLFDRNVNRTLVHQYVVSTLSNIRKGTRAQKNRSGIVASGRKPWRQKGTGRARAGSVGSPIWRGGGRAFPSSMNENFNKKINKKTRKAALSSILSKKIDDKDVIVLDKLQIDTHKTKDFIKVLRGLKIDSSVLIVTDKASDNLVLSARNLHYCDIVEPSWLNPVLLLKYKKMIITSESLKSLEGGLSV
jgi:large subunit ribosomal protein L4